LARQKGYGDQKDALAQQWKTMDDLNRDLILTKILGIPTVIKDIHLDDRSSFEAFKAKLEGRISKIMIDPLQKLNEALGVIQQLGEVYESSFADGTKTRFTVVTASGLEALLGKEKILSAINDPQNGSKNTDRSYADHSASNRTGIINQGHIVNLDLYQQVALLKAIEEKTGLTKILGFYNINGGACVPNTKANELWNTKRLASFWTAEKHLNTDEPAKYNKAGIVHANDPKLARSLRDKSRFGTYPINVNFLGDNDPGVAEHAGAFVLGLIIK
jgi:hypothetical protein